MPINDALDPEFNMVQIEIRVPAIEIIMNILEFNSKFKYVFLYDCLKFI